MKLFVMALLALSLATPSFAADENHTVTGKDLSGVPPVGGVGGMQGGGVAPGRPAPSRPQRFGEGEEGGGTARPGMSNAQLAELAITQIGELVTTLRDIQAWASLQVIVTTPDGLRVEVNLELGFGQVKVKSRKALPR